MIGTWNVFGILLIIKLYFVDGKLIGDHICLTEKSFLVNVTESYTKNVTVRNYQWCLNYPPRCSFYTINKVNSTRTVEKNETRVVEECCPSFVEQQDQCVSLCPNCGNGICENGHCNCFSGFKGSLCDLECSSEEWGPNCSRACECNSNKCDGRTGTCLEEATKMFTTETVEAATEEIPTVATVQTNYAVVTNRKEVKFNTDVIQQSTGNKNIPLHIVNGDERNTNNIFKETSGNEVTALPGNVNYQNFTINANNSHPATESSTIYTSATNYVTERNILNTLLPTSSTERDVNISSGFIDDTKADNITNVTSSQNYLNKFVDINLQIESTTHKQFPSKTFANGTIATKAGLLIPVEIQYDKLQTSSSNSHNSQDTTNPNESRNEVYLNQQTPQHHFTFNDFFLFGITLVVAFMLVVAVLGINVLRKRKRNENLQSDSNHQVAVFTASIFHSPLPDIREYEYDHPPSTGSYSAASVFNPLELKKNAKLEFKSEPIYDEIPQKEYEQNDNSTTSMSIYVNTCGRTKL